MLPAELTFAKWEPVFLFQKKTQKKILSEKEITILVSLGEGTSSASAWGCDLTYDYVKINGDYRT